MGLVLQVRLPCQTSMTASRVTFNIVAALIISVSRNIDHFCQYSFVNRIRVYRSLYVPRFWGVCLHSILKG